MEEFVNIWENERIHLNEYWKNYYLSFDLLQLGISYHFNNMLPNDNQKNIT